jgi:hypothetical protein
MGRAAAPFEAVAIVDRKGYGPVFQTARIGDLQQSSEDFGLNHFKERTMPTNEPNTEHGSPRRHFLGLAGAMGAKIALAAVALSHASGAVAKNKHGKKGGMCFLRGTSILTPTGEICPI